jgi:hypothetical protein
MTHHISPFVKAVVGTGPTGYDLVSFYGGGVDTQTVIDDFVSDFNDLCATGTTAAAWTLYEYVGTALNPIAAGSWTITPAGGVVSVAGKQWTLVCKDEDLFICKMVLPEIIAGEFQHYSSVAGIPAGAFHDFAAAFIDTAPEGWGGFVRNRNDKAAKTFIGLTCGPNRKLRRARGLA